MWITEVACGSRQHPGGTRQTPTRSRRNPVNNFGFRSGRVPGASGIGPGTRPSEENTKHQFLPAPTDVITFSGHGFSAILGSGREPKIDKKRARGRKSASGDGTGSDFCRFFSPVSFGVALRTDFSSIFHRKSRLNRGRYFTQAPDFFRRGDLKDSM